MSNMNESSSENLNRNGPPGVGSESPKGNGGCPNPQGKPPGTPPSWLVTPILAFAVAAAIVAIWRTDRAGQRRTLPGSFRYDMADTTLPPELIRWTEVTRHGFPMKIPPVSQTLQLGKKQAGIPIGLAVQRDASGRELVAVILDIGTIAIKRIGSDSLDITSTASSKSAGFDGMTGRLDGIPTCIAACPWKLPDETSETKSLGRWLIGYGDRIVVCHDGSRETPLVTLDTDSSATSIAVEDSDGDGVVDEIFVADSIERCVWRFDGHGNELGRIGTSPESTLDSRLSTLSASSSTSETPAEFRGFAIPSPYFSVAVSPDGLIRVANPGYRRVEGFTSDGYRETVFGETGERIDAFCGCCNPTHLAIFPDARIVTSEKGITRVKIYSPKGEFTEVVAGPDAFDSGTPPIDIAILPGTGGADSAGSVGDRIFVLDPKRGQVRAFARL